MPSPQTSSSAAEDWRLLVQLTGEHAVERAGRLHHQLRDSKRSDGEADAGGSTPSEANQAFPEHLVLTHDDCRLFAYSDSEQTLERAEEAVEAALGSERSSAKFLVSRWDPNLADWLQVKPPPDAQQRSALQTRRRSFDEPESRTLVLSAGRFVRAEVERTLANYAEQLGLSCQIVEHPHLLITQIAFTLSGESGKIDEFAAAMRAEGMASLRADAITVSSAL